MPVPLTLRVLLDLLRRPPVHRYGDDRQQAAELSVPDGDGPFPVVVLLHGGYWRARYGKWVMRPVARDLVRRGVAVWNLEYRRLGRGGGWPSTFDDVGAGIDALATVGDPRLDLDRVSAAGHSAGGHLALCAGGRDAGAVVRVRRVAALAPITNLSVVGAVAHELMGGTPADVPDRYALCDPLLRAPLDIPVLLVHAADDRTVPVRRSREYTTRARAGGGEVEMVEIGEGGHRTVIDPPSNAWRVAADWLTRTPQ